MSVKILILKEHHGERYLDISTQAKLDKVALSVVKGRFSGENDYYPMEESDPPEPLDFTEEDISKMPESLKKTAQTTMDQYKRRLQQYEADQKREELVKGCLETNDAKLAWKILNSRKCNEDESFQVVDVDEEYVV